MSSQEPDVVAFLESVSQQLRVIRQMVNDNRLKDAKERALLVAIFTEESIEAIKEYQKSVGSE